MKRGTRLELSNFQSLKMIFQPLHVKIIQTLTKVCLSEVVTVNLQNFQCRQDFLKHCGF